MMCISTFRAINSVARCFPSMVHKNYHTRDVSKLYSQIFSPQFKAYSHSSASNQSTRKLSGEVVTPLDIKKLGLDRFRQFEKWLRPGRGIENSALSGFISEHDTLEDIAQKDAAIMKELGVDYTQIADAIERVSSYSEYTVCVTSWRGFQVCPFEGYVDDCDQVRSSIDIAIGGKRGILKIPGLMLHLLRSHHFCEGNVPYRLDPVRACHILKIGKQNIN